MTPVLELRRCLVIGVVGGGARLSGVGAVGCSVTLRCTTALKEDLLCGGDCVAGVGVGILGGTGTVVFGTNIGAGLVTCLGGEVGGLTTGGAGVGVGAGMTGVSAGGGDGGGGITAGWWQSERASSLEGGGMFLGSSSAGSGVSFGGCSSAGVSSGGCSEVSTTVCFVSSNKGSAVSSGSSSFSGGFSGTDDSTTRLPGPKLTASELRRAARLLGNGGTGSSVEKLDDDADRPVPVEIHLFRGPGPDSSVGVGGG